MSTELNFGNWIRKRVLWRLGLSALGLVVLAILPLPTIVRILAGILGLVMLISFLFPLYAYYSFSPRGGNIQKKIYDLIVENLGGPINGKILDIGAGNGVLAVLTAQKNPQAEITGMDYWGEDWEYAKSVCEDNASRANVSNRVHFVRGDAAKLEFGDSAFDAATSNLTFHEVQSVPQKSNVLKEALRVIKPGGQFAFVDYFYEPRHYGPTAEFQTLLNSLGLIQVQLTPLASVLPIPVLLRHPKALGRVGIVSGRK